MNPRLPNVIVTEDYGNMSHTAAAYVIEAVRLKPESLICLATGASPVGVYAELARRRETLEHVHVLKLDEWGGLAMDDPATCEVYIQKHALEPWGVSPDHYTGFVSSASDPRAECRRVEEAVNRLGCIDIAILGMGADGHIGLNYPSDTLPAHAHVTDASTLRHAMLNCAQGVATHGLTLGMADILRSRLIVLVINGEGKADAVVRLLSGDITAKFPASLLWLHTNVVCVLHRAAAARLESRQAEA